MELAVDALGRAVQAARPGDLPDGGGEIQLVEGDHRFAVVVHDGRQGQPVADEGRHVGRQQPVLAGLRLDRQPIGLALAGNVDIAPDLEQGPELGVEMAVPIRKRPTAGDARRHRRPVRALQQPRRENAPRIVDLALQIEHRRLAVDG